MQKDQIDQGLSFKKRARRRLVGAIALVLLMVIILPMMLEDRENAVQDEDVEIIMPTQEVELEQNNTTESVVEGEFEELVIQEQSDAEVADVELPNTESQPTKTDPKKVVKVEEKPPVIKTTEKKETVKKQPTPKNDINNGKYYVQIGVFSNPSNIKKLQVKLDDLGYQSLTEKITTDTGEKTRLRTKSFIGRNEAAIALENIKDAGLAGMVVSQK